MALVCLADGIVGVSFGATAVAGGLPWWVPVAMSLLVFAGGSQFAADGVVLAGGGPLAAVAAGAVLNTRLLPYGFAVADVTSEGRRVGRPGPGHAAARRAADHRRVRGLRAAARRPGAAQAAFWTCGAALFVVWNIGVPLGVLAGSAIRNTARSASTPPSPP